MNPALPIGVTAHLERTMAGFVRNGQRVRTVHEDGEDNLVNTPD
jgi:hypothetical protein